MWHIKSIDVSINQKYKRFYQSEPNKLEIILEMSSDSNSPHSDYYPKYGWNCNLE